MILRYIQIYIVGTLKINQCPTNCPQQDKSFTE